MVKFKIGDKVQGLSWFTRTLHTGRIIEIDKGEPDLTYKIKSETSGEPWLLNDTVELVEEKEMNNYKKLMNFMEENEIELTELHDLVKNLDKLGDLEFEIQDTKDLIEETEEELERLYEELSELEDERNELLK